EGYELGDVDGVLGGYAQVGNLRGLDHDVLALGVLVALDDLILLHWGGRFVGRLLDSGGENLLVADPLAGRARDLMKADLGLGFRGDKQFDAEGDERNLNLTGPIWTRQCDTS